MKSVDELFKVEVGRVRTIEEVVLMVEKLRPIVESYKRRFDEAVKQPFENESMLYGGGKRREAIENVQEDFPDGVSYEIALEGLLEILPDMEVAPNIPKIAEHHIRNARFWSGMFGSDSLIRIDVFSWISGVEPNYDPLDDATEEEEEQYRAQMEQLVKPIKDALKGEE